MSKFESIMSKIFSDLLIAGEILGPVFIHSAHGTAILNASEETVAALVQANQTGVAAQLRS